MRKKEAFADRQANAPGHLDREKASDSFEDGEIYLNFAPRAFAFEEESQSPYKQQWQDRKEQLLAETGVETPFGVRQGEDVEPSSAVKLRTEINDVIDQLLGGDAGGAEDVDFDGAGVELSPKAAAIPDNEAIAANSGSPAWEAESEEPFYDTERLGGDLPPPGELPPTSTIPTEVGSTEFESADLDSFKDVVDGSEKYMRTLKMLKEEQAVRMRQQQRTSEIEHELAERSMKYEVELDTLRLQHIELNKKVRMLEAGSSYADIFADYEKKTSSLEAELRACQGELARVSAMMELNGKHGEQEGDVAAKRHMRSANRAATEMSSELVKLRAEAADVQRKQRLYEGHEKRMKETTRRLIQFGDKVEAMELRLETAKSRAAAEAHRADQLAERCRRLESENAALIADRENASKEMAGMRLYVAQVDREKKQGELLERFLNKRGAAAAAATSSASTTPSAQASKTDASIDNINRQASSLAKLISKLRAHALDSTDSGAIMSVVARVEAKVQSLLADHRSMHVREQDLLDALAELVDREEELVLKSPASSTTKVFHHHQDEDRHTPKVARSPVNGNDSVLTLSGERRRLQSEMVLSL